MHARIIINAVFLTMLGSAGCAAVDVEPAESAAESTAESEVAVQCSDKTWLVNFYAEAEHLNLVGTLRCNCFRPQTRTGVTSNFPVLAFEFTCSLD
jgi:hypothetical protein